MLRLYYADCTGLAPEPDASAFSEYRLKKLDSVRSPELRRQMIAAEQLLLYAVREVEPRACFPLNIQTGPNGKPYLAECDLHFSLSHSGSWAACALSDTEIGLDIQKLSEPREALLKRVFTEEERRYLMTSAEKRVAFARLWALKESYVKATGEGITRRFDSISLRLRDGVVTASDTRARFWTFGVGGFQAALCTLDGSDPRPERTQKLELGW